MKHDINSIAIIGAGASGLSAGISALKMGKKVVIYEKNSSSAKKILITGNGKCNVSNANISMQNYHGDPFFAWKVIGDFDSKKCMEFFESLGVYLVQNENGRLYPMSLQASCIANALEMEFLNLGGIIYHESCLQKITKQKDFYELHINEKIKHHKNLIIASGSKAFVKDQYKMYDILKDLGLALHEVYPTLVQLQTKEDLSQCAGVKIKAKATLLIDDKKICSFEDDVLFAKYGLSGLAILGISREASANIKSKNIKVHVDLFYQLEAKKLSSLMEKIIINFPKRSLLDAINGMINKKLAKFILHNLHFSKEILCENLNKKDINKIAHAFKNQIFNITDTKGFAYAEVCSGGVATHQIDEKSMECKNFKGLFICGEVLDVDGDCGGYNLHFAWASGIRAGKNAAIKI